MNTIDTTTLDGKIAVMEAFRDGKMVQCISADPVPDQEWRDFGKNCKPSWNWIEFDYRIKPLEFPPLPEGLTWHNKDGLTPEQVGEGWRLLVQGEVIPTGSQYWWVDGGTWHPSNRTMLHQNGRDTLRCPSSTPFPEPPKRKVRVPLGPGDINPTDVFRHKDRSHPYAEHWIAVSSVNGDGPTLKFAVNGTHRIPFSSLMTEWEISRDGGKTWPPCSKEG